MKKLEIIIKPEKIDSLQDILEKCKAHGAMISNIQGYGNQKGHKEFYRGAELDTKMLPKLKVETVIDDDTAEKIIEKVVEHIKTGNYGDGKIFVYQVEDAVRIRTGEHGKEAL